MFKENFLIFDKVPGSPGENLPPTKESPTLGIAEKKDKTKSETKDELEQTAAPINAEIQSSAGTLQEYYFEKRLKEKVNKKTYEDELKKMSAEDIRYGKFFEENKKITDLKQRVENIQNETIKRLLAYTDYNEQEDSGDYKDKWFALDYQKIGGAEHEREIGLGDILIDPSIKNILVIKDGQILKAHRGTVPGEKAHGGRVGFMDENNDYIATHTKDKFRILSNSETLDTDEQRKKYLGEMDTEIDDRNKHKEIYKAERMSFRISSKVSEKITALLKEIREKNPQISDILAYGEATKLAKEKAIATTDEEEKQTYLLAAQDCEDNVKMLELLPKFSLDLYKKKICAVESNGGNYNARNDNIGKKKGVPPDKWAFGKYQFIAPTGNSYGAKINPTDETSIQGFLTSHMLQEEVMNRFTMENLKRYMSHPQEQRDALERNGYDVYKVLAAMHFTGGSNIDWGRGIVRETNDWAGGYMSKYFDKMDTATA